MQNSDGIVILKISDLKKVVSQAVKSEINTKFDEIKGFIENLTIKKDLPPWVRESKAAELLGIKPKTLAYRRKNGYFREGLDFIRKSDKIILYDTDALLNLKG